MLRSFMSLAFLLLGCCCISLSAQQTTCIAKVKKESCATKQVQQSEANIHANVILVNQKKEVDQAGTTSGVGVAKLAKQVGAANCNPSQCLPKDCDPSQCKPKDCDPKNCDPANCDLSKCSSAVKASLVGSQNSATLKNCVPSQCKKAASEAKSTSTI